AGFEVDVDPEACFEPLDEVLSRATVLVWCVMDNVRQPLLRCHQQPDLAFALVSQPFDKPTDLFDPVQVPTGPCTDLVSNEDHSLRPATHGRLLIKPPLQPVNDTINIEVGVILKAELQALLCQLLR